MSARLSRYARRATLCGSFGLAFFFSAPAASAQSRVRPEPQYATDANPDQAEGKRVLQEFRGQGIAGDFALEFSLRVMPRRGADRWVTGRLLGTRNDRGPVTLTEFTPGSEGPARLLLQNGPAPEVWTLAGANAGNALAIGVAQLFQPLAGTDLSAFDLQMPFLYWDDVVYEGVVRLRNRPTHRFIAYPPAALAAIRPELSGVRFYLDTQFSALVQAEQLDATKQVAKTMSVVSLKRTQDQWIPRTIDLRDDRTRNKTQFIVDAAALNLSLPRSAFEPGRLADAPPVVEAKRFDRFK